MSDMAPTEPTAGLMVNSMGLAWRSRASLPLQLFLDTSILSQLMLGDPRPSPGTRRAKVIGTKEVLEMLKTNVSGKPAWSDKDRMTRSNDEQITDRDKCVTKEGIKSGSWRLIHLIQQHKNELTQKKKCCTVTHQSRCLRNRALRRWIQK